MCGEQEETVGAGFGNWCHGPYRDTHLRYLERALDGAATGTARDYSYLRESIGSRFDAFQAG